MEDNNFNNGDDPIFNVEPLNRSMNINNENDANTDPIFNVEPLHSNNVESENSQNNSFNVEPLQSSTNNNVQNETNLDNNNYANGNNVGGDSFANAEPLQKRTDMNNQNIQNTDYLNDTTPAGTQEVNGRKFTPGNSAFGVYAVILFILSLFSGVITKVDTSDLLDTEKYVGLFVTIGIKVGIFIFITAMIAVFIAFIKKYTNENGLAVFKRYHLIYYGLWAGYNIYSRLTAYVDLSKSFNKLKMQYSLLSYDSELNAEANRMLSSLRTGMILNTIIVVAAMAITFFVVNKLVERKFTMKNQNQV